MEATMIRAGLLIHIGSALFLMAGVVGELLSGHLLTRAEDTSQVRILSRLAEYAGRVAALSLVGLLLSGPDLASRTGFFAGDGVKGWIAVAIVVIVVIGAMGGGVHRKTFKAAGELAGSGAEPITAELRAHLARPLTWVSMHTVIGVVLATVWIMSNKPSGAVDALVPVTIGGLIGAGAGVVVARMTAARLA